MIYIFGEQKTMFWGGEKFVFKRVSKEGWECISGQSTIPADLVKSLEEWTEVRG